MMVAFQGMKRSLLSQSMLLLEVLYNHAGKRQSPILEATKCQPRPQGRKSKLLELRRAGTVRSVPCVPVSKALIWLLEIFQKIACPFTFIRRRAPKPRKCLPPSQQAIDLSSAPGKNA